MKVFIVFWNPKYPEDGPENCGVFKSVEDAKKTFDFIVWEDEEKISRGVKIVAYGKYKDDLNGRYEMQEWLVVGE